LKQTRWKFCLIGSLVFGVVSCGSNQCPRLSPYAESQSRPVLSAPQGLQVPRRDPAWDIPAAQSVNHTEKINQREDGSCLVDPPSLVEDEATKVD